jgi:putative FmdB family regulatory protein
MPVYEYFCKTCDDTFEVRTSMSNMTAVAECPEGHAGARKVLSVFATVSSGSAEPAGEACCSPMGCGAEACCFSEN